MRIKVDLNTYDLMAPHAHGFHTKNLFVCHESISPDVVGLSDIEGVENYLADKDYGIHGCIDLEGHTAWARMLGAAVFWQAGGVNEQSVGTELISRGAPIGDPAFWGARDRQLRALAKLLAAWHNGLPALHPLVYSDHPGPDGTFVPGVTSHYDVSQYFAASEGHTDCRPIHKGGSFPILSVIKLARVYARQPFSYRF